MDTLRSGRLYRVTGASSQTGEDVEITVQAHDERDAARTANRQGVYVSTCVAAGPDGSGWATAARHVSAPADGTVRELTFAEAVARDPVVQRLLLAHPRLEYRVSRLNEEDQEYLSNLLREGMGISHRDSSHMAELMRNPQRLP